MLWLGCLLYAALFTWLGAIKYDAHRNLVDFGIFVQTAASAFGCFCNSVEGSHWAFHFSPILYLAGALVALVHSPLVLIALQAVVGALTAPPIYGLVLRERGDVTAARLAAVVVWIYPALAGLIFGDFHENGFAPDAVAWTLYAFDAGLLRWAIVGAIVTLAVKEDQAIFLAIAGALGAWRFRGTAPGRAAAGVAIASTIIAIAFFTYIQPHATQRYVIDVQRNATLTQAHVEQPYATSVTQLYATSVTLSEVEGPRWQPARFYAWNPSDVRGLVFGGIAARMGFLLLAFVPLLFLPFRSRMMWLAAAPLAEVLLSRMPTAFTLGTHYAGAWIGYVLVAFAFAVRRLTGRSARYALTWCAALCIVEFLVADPLHPGLNLRPAQPRDVTLDRYLAALPLGVSIATQEEAYTHLALEDPYARPLPESPDIETQACFVLIDRDFPQSARLQEYGDTFANLVRTGRYAMVDRTAGIELYRRIHNCR